MAADGTRAVQESTFLIAANGSSDSPPASALRDWLVAHHAKRVTWVLHPLNAEEPPIHEVVTYERGEEVSREQAKLPSRPPATYPLDLFVPLVPPKVDAWFAYTNLLALRGVAARRMRRAGSVVLWSVDFVPDRFGAGAPLTRVYDGIDKLACQHVDGRVELSEPARDGRNARHGLAPGEGGDVQIVPIGTWLARVPKAPEDAIDRRRLVFIGHLVERMGIGVFFDALAELARRGVAFSADIAGRGPLEDSLRERARELGLADAITFHGFISDHSELETLLAGAAIGLAPYDSTGDSFTRFADPSKLKAYLGAGLPILLTDVPPNARELAAEGGGELVDYDPTALAGALERLLGDPEEWRRRRAAAMEYAQRFDWERLVGDALGGLGFVDR